MRSSSSVPHFGAPDSHRVQQLTNRGFYIERSLRGLLSLAGRVRQEPVLEVDRLPDLNLGDCAAPISGVP